MMFERLKRSISFLRNHPAYREQPLRVMTRIGRWEFCKLLNHEPVIRVHQRSRMRLTPGARRGMTGLIYVFRDRLEPGLPASIRKYVARGDTVYDIGANIGLWSTLLAEAVGPEGRVESFEPVSRTVRRLEENLALSGLDNVGIHKLAIGAAAGEITMFVPPDAGRSALARESDRDIEERVQLISLDEFWAGSGSPKVSFVKMDVEGSEPQVLRGAHHFITGCRPIFITEVNRHKLSLMKEEADAIHSILLGYDYTSMLFDDDRHEFQPGGFNAESDFYEVLFVPRGVA